MEELLGLVRQLGAKALSHQTLQTKASSVAKSLSAATQTISNEETVRVYQMFRVPVEKVKINDADSAIQVLEQIQVAMDPQIRARAAVRNKALENLWDGGAATDPTESLTVRLSLASKDSLAASELQAKLQGFYNELGQFEQKLKQADEPGSPHASILSQASLLRSVLESESPLDRAQAQTQIESFMAKLEQVRTEMAKGHLLQSEQGSTFSSESVLQDPLASPVRPKGPLSNSWLSDASNVDGPGVREWLDKMYDTLGKLEHNLKTKPPLAPSVHQSAFESQSELGDGVNQPLPDLPGKLDFKKSQSIGGKKGGLSIEVDSQQVTGAPREPFKQHPQSTKHVPAIKADKRLSGSRQYISTGRQIGKASDPEDELDAELEDKRQHSAGNEELEDDDQSLFSNKTPRYFYELRAGDTPGDIFKPPVADFDGLPLFASNEKQPDYSAQILEGHLQFEQTKLLLAKSAAKQAPVRTAADFLDPDFKPWFLSIVGDPNNSDNLGLSVERRLQWKRAKYLGLTAASDTAVRLWLPETLVLPQRELNLSPGKAETPILANLLSSLLGSDLLPKGLCTFLGEADPHLGKYTFVLHDHLGTRVRIEVDDFLPCLTATTAKFSPDNLGFLGPITLTGLEGLSDSRVDKVHFLLPCLLEKALAKLFGNYVSLHRSHPATLAQALLGPGIYTFQTSKAFPQIVSDGLQIATPVFALRSRPTKTKVLDRLVDNLATGLQFGDHIARDFGKLKDSHRTLLVHGTLPGLSLNPKQFFLGKSTGGLGLKLADAAARDKAYLGISFKYASSKGCSEVVCYSELLGSKNLQECHNDHGPVLESSDWVLPWASLPDEELFLLVKASSEVDLYVAISEGVQARELDPAEVSKIKRGIVKKHNNQQPEMLKEFFTQSRPVNGSVTFKIHNPELVKGKLGTLVGALHRRDWMIEHNGVEVSLKPTTVLQPASGKNLGLQQLEYVNLLALEGIDVETLRVYPARKTPWSSAIGRSALKSLAEQLEQIRLVFN